MVSVREYLRGVVKDRTVGLLKCEADVLRITGTLDAGAVRAVCEHRWIEIRIKRWNNARQREFVFGIHAIESEFSAQPCRSGKLEFTDVEPSA
jgi:hypothetical protein